MRVRLHGLALMVGLGMGLVVGALVMSIMSRHDYREIALLAQPVALRANALTGEITSASKIVQTFRPKQDNLTAVQVFMSNYGHPNDAAVVLSVTGKAANKVLRVSKAMPGTVADNDYHLFEFPPISNSKDRTLLLTLTSPQGAPGRTVTAWLSDEDPYPQGTAFVNGIRRPRQDVVLTVIYRIGDPAVELVNRASQYKPAFFKGRNLQIFAILALLTTVISTIAVAASAFPSNDPNTRAVDRSPP